jgi:hypothetical protein
MKFRLLSTDSSDRATGLTDGQIVDGLYIDSKYYVVIAIPGKIVPYFLNAKQVEEVNE